MKMKLKDLVLIVWLLLVFSSCCLVVTGFTVGRTTPARRTAELVGDKIVHVMMATTSTSSGADDNKSEQTLTLTTTMNDKQLDFCMGYLNKHHTDLLILFAEVYSDLGRIKVKKNAFSGGSYKIDNAKIVNIDNDNIYLDVTINERGKVSNVEDQVVVSLDSDPIASMQREYPTHPTIPLQDLCTVFDAANRMVDANDLNQCNNAVDFFVRRMNRLCNIVRKHDVTGKLIQLGIQIGDHNGQNGHHGVGYIQDNLYLNQVPHNRYVRQYFYDMAANATIEALMLCSSQQISNRMKVISMFPELNPSMVSKFAIVNS